MSLKQIRRWFSTINPSHLHEIEDGLLSFCASSPNEALREVEVYLEGNEMEINLDVDATDRACCEITMTVDTDFNEDYTIKISLQKLRISRSEGCRSGNEYLGAIREMLEHFFTHSNPLFASMPIRRMYFEVEEDVSSIRGVEPVHITNFMYDTTVEISRGNGNFYNPKLSELLQDRDVADFWSYVVRDTFDVRELANIVLTNRMGLEEFVYRLLCKFWYHDVLPQIVEPSLIPRGKISTNDDDDSDDPGFIHSQIDLGRINLGLITLLSREDFKTWYMARLNLSLCDERGLVDASELEAAVRRFQSEPFVNAVPDSFRRYFEHAPSLTTKDVVLQCMGNLRARKRLSYFEALQMYMIDFKHNHHFDALKPYFTNVCRNLIPGGA